MSSDPQRYKERTKNWQRFGTSIFSQMTALANEVGAINLAQGFPDFDGPDAIKARAIKAVNDGPNQYCPSIGIKTLRERIAARRNSLSISKYDPDQEVTVTTGATEGLYAALQALLQPGDEVISFTPAYDMYEPAAHARGAKVKFVNLLPPSFEFSLEDLERKISPNTQVIVLNSPQNPSGKIFSLHELGMIAEVAIKHDLIVVSDEVYEEIVFDGQRHISIADVPGMRNRTVVVSSTAKTYSMTGWKVGYILAPDALTVAIRNVHQYTVFCTASPLQDAMVAAFDLPSSYYLGLRASMQASRDKLLEVLNQNGWRVTVPQGTYFVTADYSKMHSGIDQDVARNLALNCGIATVPMSTFYPNQESMPSSWLRFAFCKTAQTMEAAIHRIEKIDWSKV